jgi:hypothetical protein
VPRPVVKTSAVFIADMDREWVRRKWALIRAAHQTADNAYNQWRRVSAEIDDYLDAHGITDIVQRGHVRSESLTLRDHYETMQWMRGEAHAHASDIDLYLKLKEWGLL